METSYSMDKCYSVTIEAYGRREKFIGLGKSHRHPEVTDQAKHDGEVLLSYLDGMYGQEPDDPSVIAKRWLLDPEAVERVAEAMCQAVIGSHDRRTPRPRLPITEAMPVDDRARLVAVYALRDLLGW